jgi:KipI family sensor histidine kinase inhibitor
VVELPVVFDGADLADVAELTRRSLADVVGALTTAELTVAFCGFAPGFGYLTGLPADLHVPRRTTPRTRVPAGSVGLAGPFAGVYPQASPGGWQLVGRTDAVLFDVDRDPPALLSPGTVVRFRDVT